MGIHMNEWRREVGESRVVVLAKTKAFLTLLHKNNARVMDISEDSNVALNTYCKTTSITFPALSVFSSSLSLFIIFPIFFSSGKEKKVSGDRSFGGQGNGFRNKRICYSRELFCKLL